MRLWHYKLIPVLPRQQLVAQWRECCAIASNMAKNGTPNHILVNKITQYPITEFVAYTNLVLKVMRLKKYRISEKAYTTFCENLNKYVGKNICYKKVEPEEWKKPFECWHDDRYLIQCYYNLQEKYDCGGISTSDWEAISKLVDIKE